MSTRAHRYAETARFIELLRAEDVRSYLEIGARTGETFEAIVRALPAGSRGVAVDLPGAAWGVRGSDQQLLDVVARLNRDGYRCSAIFGSSQSPSVIEAVAKTGPYDAVFIDADHRYQSVAADYENYRALGRLVAFHDIAGVGIVDRPTGLAVDVPRLWSEVKSFHRHTEIVEPGSILGVGVLHTEECIR